MTREEEAKIIRAVVDGNTNAFEDLVLEYQKQVYHITLKMTGNEEDAFDLSQETFLKAFRALSSFRGEAGFGSWLYRLTANLCIDFLRKKKRQGGQILRHAVLPRQFAVQRDGVKGGEAAVLPQQGIAGDLAVGFHVIQNGLDDMFHRCFLKA